MPMALKVLVYPLFALFCFVFFCLVLFPFDSVRGRIESEIKRSLGGAYDITIGKIDLSLPAGVDIEKVHVFSLQGQRTKVAQIDEAELNIGLLALVMGKLDVNYDIRAAGGRIQGNFKQTKENIAVEADLKNVNLAAVPLIKENWGIGISSDVDGDVDIELYPRTPLKNNGSIQLKIDQLKTEAGNIKGFLALPDLTLATPQSQSKIDVIMNRGSVEIRKLGLSGGDLTLDLGGKVYLAQRLSNLRFNVRGKMGVSEKLDKALPFLMIVQKYKGQDGLYPLTMTGQLRKPNIRIGEFRVPM